MIFLKHWVLCFTVFQLHLLILDEKVLGFGTHLFGVHAFDFPAINKFFYFCLLVLHATPDSLGLDN